jgi:hypothetical protein
LNKIKKAARRLVERAKRITEENVPTNKDLWQKVIDVTKGEKKSVTANGKTVEAPNDGAGFDVFPSAYASAWAVQRYEELGGNWTSKNEVVKEGATDEYFRFVDNPRISPFNQGYNAWIIFHDTAGGSLQDGMDLNPYSESDWSQEQDWSEFMSGWELAMKEKPDPRAITEDVDDWFDQKWVDISRTDDDGNHPPCGDSSDEGKRKEDPEYAYPKCVPKAKADQLTKKEKERLVRRKRDAERNDNQDEKGGDSPTMTSSDPEKQNESLREILRKMRREAEDMNTPFGEGDEKNPNEDIRESFSKPFTGSQKREVDEVVSKLIQENEGPDQGDRVRLTLDRETMTPAQREMNGQEGVVIIKDPFSYGSDHVRYSVRFDSPVETADGDYYTINNLTPEDIEKV